MKRTVKDKGNTLNKSKVFTFESIPPNNYGRENQSCLLYDRMDHYYKVPGFAAKLLAPSCTAPSIRCAKIRNVCLTPSAVVVIAFLPSNAWCDLMASKCRKQGARELKPNSDDGKRVETGAGR